MSESFETSRRGFLGAAAAFGAVTLAPGVVLYARPADEPVTDKVRWGMLVDATQCDNECTACVDACNKEFGLAGHERPASDPQWIRKVKVTDRATGRSLSMPVMCQHCAHPPCLDVCPTGASFRRVDGIVLINRHICIGCRYCVMACPYKARSFVHEELTDQKPYAPRGKGTAEACTMCVHRVDEDRKPACVEACSSHNRVAMLFGDLNDPNSEISKRIAAVNTTQLRSEMRTDTGVRYQGL